MEVDLERLKSWASYIVYWLWKHSINLHLTWGQVSLPKSAHLVTPANLPKSVLAMDVLPHHLVGIPLGITPHETIPKP
jgi:hypothetical protein